MYPSYRIAFAAAGLAVAGLVAAVPASAAQARRHALPFQIGGGAFLGVSIEDVGTADVAALGLKEEAGARVSQVEPDSPASRAGLAEGDVIVGFAGEKVRSAAQLTRLVRETPAGRTVAVEVSRDGKRQVVSAELGEAPGPEDFARDVTRRLRFQMPVPPDAPDAPELPSPDDVLRWHGRDGSRFALRGRGPLKLGIGFLPLTDQLAAHYGVKGGVLVSEVTEDTPAHKAGVQAGDIVVSFDGHAVTDVRSLLDQVADAKPGSEVPVTVQRAGKSVKLKVLFAERERRGRQKDDKKNDGQNSDDDGGSDQPPSDDETPPGVKT